MRDDDLHLTRRSSIGEDRNPSGVSRREVFLRADGRNARDAFLRASYIRYGPSSDLHLASL